MRRKRPCRRGGRRRARRPSSRYCSADLGARGLRRGMRGRDVRTLQRLLGLPPDGDFGARTARVVRRFQRRAGLDSDGHVGPATSRALARRRMSGRMATWYGPGLYGNRTACGQTLTGRDRCAPGIKARRLQTSTLALFGGCGGLGRVAGEAAWTPEGLRGLSSASWWRLGGAPAAALKPWAT